MILLTALITWAMTVFLLCATYSQNERISESQQEQLARTEYIRDEMNKSDEINDSILLAYINELNMMFPEIVLAQAIEETGHYTSSAFNNNKNLFGMKEAKQRATTGMSADKINEIDNGIFDRKNSKYAHYKDWRKSVIDYALWQMKYCGKMKTENEYYVYLGKVYAENPGYVWNLKRIVNGMKEKGVN